MTIAELIAELGKLPPDLHVIIQADAEGTIFKPLAGLWTGRYETSAEAMMLAELTDEDRAQGYTDEDVSRSGAPAVALYPSD